MKTVTQKLCRYLRGVVALSVGCASIVGYTENNFFNEDFGHHSIEADDFNLMKIQPTSLMETSTLFRAAEAQRDSSMNMTHRLFNNRWLLDDDKSSLSGSEALRRYLRLYFIKNWKVESDNANAKGSLYMPVVKPEEPSQFADISNYRLRISNDKFNVRFKYTFD